MIEWRPIETAPRDGTEILVFEPAKGEYGSQYIAVVSFKEQGWNGPKWYETLNEEHTVDEPTHWMPLPKPPTEIGE